MLKMFKTNTWHCEWHIWQAQVHEQTATGDFSPLWLGQLPPDILALAGGGEEDACKIKIIAKL